MNVFYKGKFPGISQVFQILILTGFTLPLALVSTNVLIGIGHVKGLFFSVLGGTLIFFTLNRLLVPQMAATGAALSVLVSTTAIGIFAFTAMRRELSISMKGIIKSAKNLG